MGWQKTAADGLRFNRGGNVHKNYATIFEIKLYAPSRRVHFYTDPPIAGRTKEWGLYRWQVKGSALKKLHDVKLA
jgi:hypothetical protein